MTRRAVAIFVLAAAAYGAGTHAGVFSAGNDASRWAQVEALVDYGTPSIESSRFRATVDRVLLDGREYSNKPPLLAFTAAALYAPLRAVTGWRLADPRSGGRVIRLLTWLLVGLPAALLVARFDGALAAVPDLSRAGRTLLTLGLGGGTLVTSYAVTFNNHVPAALAMLLAVLAAFDRRPLACGTATGLAAAIDLLPGLGAAPFLLGMLLSGGTGTLPRPRRSMVVRFLGCATIGLVLAVATNVATTGSVLPPKFVPGAVDLSAQAGPSLAGVVLPQSPRYGLEILFGGHGLFLVSPILFVGVAGLAMHVRRRAPGRDGPGDGCALAGETPQWRWLTAALVFQVLVHALLAGSYGGWSYGYRYLIPIQPLLLLAAPVAMVPRAGRVALAALLGPSLLAAALGAYHPWPPAFEQVTAGDPVASRVTQPVGGNAAAWLVEHFPDSEVTRVVGERFVDPDPAMRRRYFRLFFGSKADLVTMSQFAP